MKIAVVGLGGIGGTFAARLAHAGHAVTLVARGEHADALRRQGLHFIDEIGSASGIYPLPCVPALGELGVQDMVILAVKAHQIASALPAVLGAIGPGTCILAAINGLPWWYFQGPGLHAAAAPLHAWNVPALDPDGHIAAALPVSQVIGCVVHLAAQRETAGTVRATAGRRLIVGAASAQPGQSAQAAGMGAITGALLGAGFDVQGSPDIRHDVWVKLVGNLSFNPVAALTGYRMDQICGDEGVLEVIRAMLQESAAVALQLGIDVGMTPDQRIDIARQLGRARISMLQDFESGRTLELAPIVEAVLQVAERLGATMPVTRGIHALTRARELSRDQNRNPSLAL